MGQSPPPRTRVWIARSAYTYFHLPMITRIIAVVAADELMVAHPGDRGTAASFALLALVPLTTFRAIALTMVLGLLLDTFLVRQLLVAALIVLVGRRSGWPGRQLGQQPWEQNRPARVEESDS